MTTDIIRATREKRGLTQEDVADLLNTTRSNYAYLENRGEKLSIEQLERIAAALGVNMFELLPDAPRTVDGIEALDLRTKVQEEINEILKREYEETRRKLGQIAETLCFHIEQTMVLEAYHNGLLKKSVAEKFGKVIPEGDDFYLGELYPFPTISIDKIQEAETYVSKNMPVEVIAETITLMEENIPNEYTNLIMLSSLNLFPKDSIWIALNEHLNSKRSIKIGKRRKNIDD
jgi:transcriptional regulator with XRE-family HTH domain